MEKGRGKRKKGKEEFLLRKNLNYSPVNAFYLKNYASTHLRIYSSKKHSPIHPFNPLLIDRENFFNIVYGKRFCYISVNRNYAVNKVSFNLFKFLNFFSTVFLVIAGIQKPISFALYDKLCRFA